MNKQTKYITRTGILIALTVVFQSLSKFVPLGQFSNFITGSLVNACLLISVSMVGLWSGAIVGVITPVAAILTGSAIPIVFTPFIMLGNFSLVLSFHLLKKSKTISIIVPAIIKSLFLYVAINIMLSIMGLPAQKATMMLYLFSWPQLITALIGGVLSVIVVNRIKSV